MANRGSAHTPGRAHEGVTRTSKVEGHAKGRAQLVVARVALADGRVRVVDAREDTGLAELVRWRRAGPRSVLSGDDQGAWPDGI